MTKDEALKLALEALEYRGSESWRKRQPAITAIKEALAQPEHCSDCGQKLGDANHIHTCSPQPEQKSVAMADYMALTEKYVALKAAQPEQEPVAFINVEQRKLEWAKYVSWDTPTVVNLPKIPLYTTPPQRTWVGLTDEDKASFWIADQMSQQEWDELFNAIEAKLKEKNTCS